MKIFILLCFIWPLALSGQNLPVDAATGKIYYSDEVLIKDGPKTDLYNRAKAWLAASTNLNFLQRDDLTNGLLIGTKYILLSVPYENKLQNFKLWYVFKIEVADDRYFYSIADLKLQPLPSPPKLKAEPLLPLEPFIFSEKKMQLKQSEKQFREKLALKAHASILNEIKELHTQML